MSIFDNWKCKRNGHDYDNRSVCRVCGKECEHSWKSNEVKKCLFWCRECRATKYEHSWDESICTVCGKRREHGVNHDWEVLPIYKKEEEIGNTNIYYLFDIEERICKKCGLVQTKRLRAYCAKCGEAGDFSWTSDGDITEFKFDCKNCNTHLLQEYKNRL